MQEEVGNRLCIYSSAAVWTPFIAAFCGDSCDLFKGLSLHTAVPCSRCSRSRYPRRGGKMNSSCCSKASLHRNHWQIPSSWHLKTGFGSFFSGLGLGGREGRSLGELMLQFIFPASYSSALSFLPLRGHPRRRRRFWSCDLSLHPRRHHG